MFLTHVLELCATISWSCTYAKLDSNRVAASCSDCKLNGSRMTCAGNLHFVKFETSKIEQCLEFIQSKNLHHSPGSGQGTRPHMRVQATGGGAFKYADMFQVLPVDFQYAAAIMRFYTPALVALQ